MHLKMALAGLLVSVVAPAFSQVVPEATRRGLPLTVGFAYSNFDTDWNGRLEGPVLWADWNFYQGPAALNGFGLEVEGRDLNYGRSTGQGNLRQDTASGGAIYTLRHYRAFQPYAKFLIGYGSIDFRTSYPGYSHDSRTVYTPGGGVGYRVFRHIWVRGDYEYQFWTDFFSHNALNPQGITIGAAYEFRSFR